MEELVQTGCEVELVDDLNGAGRERERVLEFASNPAATLAHLHFVTPRHYVGALRRKGVKSIIRTEHTFVTPGSRLRSFVRAYRYRGIDLTIACSEYIREQTLRQYRVAPSRIRTVVNGVDVARFCPRPAEKQALRRKWLDFPADAYVIAVAAHFIPRKRIDMVVDAFAAVCTTLPNARLVIAGDGPEKTTYRAQVVDYGLSDVVRVLTGDNLVEEIYAASDVATLTSWGEGLPGSAMEALACSLPLVATRNPRSRRGPRGRRHRLSRRQFSACSGGGVDPTRLRSGPSGTDGSGRPSARRNSFRRAADRFGNARCLRRELDWLEAIVDVSAMDRPKCGPARLVVMDKCLSALGPTLAARTRRT